MRPPAEFLRLPFLFNVERLSYEVSTFNEADWMTHPQGLQGNKSIPLISVNGEMNDQFNGPMKITEHLESAPYIQQVIASFGEVFGRSRLMGLGAGFEIPQHRDINYHWYNRVRIHIPIVTDPTVLFYCGDTHVHMGAGESWIFDSWKPHRVQNDWDQHRVHLVVDTCGSKNFWRTVGDSEWRSAGKPRKPATVPDKSMPFWAGLPTGYVASEGPTRRTSAPTTGLMPPRRPALQPVREARPALRVPQNGGYNEQNENQVQNFHAS
jgi:hypothetical protein